VGTVYDHSCLVTVLKNTSGRTRKFSFIPPHGKELAANEEVNVVGDILEAVNRGDRFGNRPVQGLLNALDDGSMEIVSTPAPIVYDETLGTSHTLGVDNGSLSISSPCWETSLSEVADQPWD
jgi:hypothetical protein